MYLSILSTTQGADLIFLGWRQTTHHWLLSLVFCLAENKNRTRVPKEATRLLRIAADAGIPAAAFQLGVMYVEGDTTRKSDIEAIKWFRADPLLRTLGLLQRTTKFTGKPLP